MTVESSLTCLTRSKSIWSNSIKTNDNVPGVVDIQTNHPFLSNVPRQPARNMEYRKALIELADREPAIQQELWIASKRDPLFWINSFCYVYEPRRPAVMPFITWPFQDRAIAQLVRHLGRRDVGIEKSRDMGATWLGLTTLLWKWLFHSRMAFGLVSRTQDAVDKPEDPDALMWKLDFVLKHLPCWMLPTMTRSKGTLLNQTNGSIFSGYASTQDVARGGRKTAFFMDELAAFRLDDGYAAWASTQHVTNCRIAVSTPKGLAGVFSDVMRRPESEIVKLSFHWTEHPTKCRGLYSLGDHGLKVYDTTYNFPPAYSFQADGKLRSPWYDQECRRHPTPAYIAQELDIDYGGSGFPFFDLEMLEKHASEYGAIPFKRGGLKYHPETHEPSWEEQKHGKLSIWLVLTSDDEPSHANDYVIGCDISSGTGGSEISLEHWGSNSVASVVNATTGEKVAEYVDAGPTPHVFADAVAALRKWFRGPSGEAFVIWDANGAGIHFSKHMLQVSPGRLFYRELEGAVARRVNKTKVPGFYTSKETKRMILGEYAKALAQGKFVNHSLPALEEARHYIYLATGSIEHDSSTSSMDPSVAKDNHGDRVIADALAWRAIGDAPAKSVERKKLDPPYGSFDWRMKRLEHAVGCEDDWL